MYNIHYANLSCFCKQAFSQEAVQPSLDGLSAKSGRLWTAKNYLKYKNYSEVLNRSTGTLIFFGKKIQAVRANCARYVCKF